MCDDGLRSFLNKKLRETELFIYNKHIQRVTYWMVCSKMRMLWGWSTVGIGWSADRVYQVLKDAGMKHQAAACFETS